MSSSLVARRGIAAALAALAVALLCSLSLGSVTASAAPVTTGNATFSIGAGKAGKALLKSGVKVNKVAPAQLSRKGRQFVAKLPVTGLEKAGRTDASLKGAFVFRKGKHAVKVTPLNVAVLKSGKIGVGGSIQKIKPKKSKVTFINLFNVAGKATVAENGLKTTLKIKQGKVSFSAAVIGKVKNQLGLKKAPRGQVAVLNLNAVRTDEEPVDPCVENPDAEGCPVIDPYLAECSVAATAKVPGSLPAPAALPTLTGAKDIVAPGSFDWGFKSSFRSYIVFGASGSLKALDGASTVGGPPVISGFSFPSSYGKYAANDPVDTTDDQVIINGSGSAVFCATGHNFRVVVSNPTLVINGDDSRVIADVDANLSGNWIPTQRVDLAELDLDGITPFYNKSGSSVNWGDVPATLTDSGAKAICGVGADAACSYVEGTELDPVNVAIETAYDTGAGDAPAWNALATYVETNLPFPYPTSTDGGCTLPGTAGGGSNGSAARTVDEHNALGGTTAEWREDAAPAAALPEITGATANGGSLDWGVRSVLRGTINGTGEFNFAGGTSPSHTPYYGYGPGASAPVFPRPTKPDTNDPITGDMGNTPGRFFNWPASGGTFDEGAAGDADNRLVLRGTGQVTFCQTQSAQQYGTVLSNPIIVIDGANSRVSFDVATRYRLSWNRGRVDLVDLDLSEATFNSTTNGGTTTVAWNFPATGVNADPVELTQSGQRVWRLISATYIEGLLMDGLTVRATIPAG